MAVVYTQFGEETIVDYIDGTLSGSETNYIGSGTGAGSFSKTSTALFNEVSEARVAASKSQPASDKNRWVGTQTYTGTKTITNAGVLRLSSGNNLMIGVDGLSITVNAGDSIQFTIDLEQT